jgi:hypothetical protein
MQPFLEANRRRGPKAKISPRDAFLDLLMYYKMGFDYAEEASFVHQKDTTLVSALDRIRPILHATLKKRWATLPRPTPLNTTNYPYVGLLVDSTTIRCFRPKGPFNEAKIYWDGKNCCYGLKKEVAVMAQAPHYALFTQPHCVGSEHDYSIFKKGADRYAEYLTKTTVEKNAIPSDSAQTRWAIVTDSGYIGPAQDTPTVRKEAIKKPSSLRTPAERAANVELAKIRVPVEQYFGRMKKLWKFLRRTYQNDHNAFDEHFEILMWLTNEHIKMNALNESDYSFLIEQIRKSNESYNADRVKRKASAKKYADKKKQRLQQFQ